MAIRTIHAQDRLASPFFPHHCHRPTGTSAGNHTLSAADNRRFQATCQFRCVKSLADDTHGLVGWITRPRGKRMKRGLQANTTLPLATN